MSRDRDEKREERREKKPRGGGRRRELLGLCLVAAGLMIFLALMSYDPADPSFNTAGRHKIHNWIGPVGAALADLAHQFLGYGAYLIAWAPMAFGVAVLLRRPLAWVLARLTAAFLLATTVSALVEFTLGMRKGGWLGELIVATFAAHLGRAGTAISLVVIVMALAVAMFDFSVSALTLWLGDYAREMVAGSLSSARSSWAGWQKQRALAAKEEKQARKAKAHKAALADVAEDAEAAEGMAMAAEGMAEAAQALAVVDKALSRSSKKKTELAPIVHAPAGVPDGEGAADGLLPESPLDEEPQELGHIALHDDEPVEFGAWPDEPVVLKKPAEAEWQDDQKVAALAMRAAAGPLIVDPRTDESEGSKRALVKASGSVAAPKNTAFELPDISLLDYDAPERVQIDSEKLLQNARKLERKLKDYGIDGAVVEIRPGPVVTMYEFLPAAGIKVSKIAGLSDDLAMAMEAMRVRIVAPIPGKGVVGIEIPNERRETVFLKEIVSSDQFKGEASKLALAVGKDIEGKPYCMDLARAPHLLVAGATGSGKSVAINTIVLSLLYRATPDEVRLIMVDPKMLELSVYQGIPHLLLPVVTDPKKAALALRWGVEEMERRYALLSEAGVRNISGYNKKVEKLRTEGATLPLPLPGSEGNPSAELPEKLPYIVIIIDELADLMMVASREVETSIARLAQMARAAGIHLILATQRPSVDVLTGVIKANFPARMSFQVASRHDSRTILDAIGAENLLGMGDMLLTPPGVGGLMRAHGAYVSEVEIQRVVEFLKTQGKPEYDESILKPRDDDGEGEGGGAGGEDDYEDELYDQAVAFVAEQRYASVSMLQRRMRIGYNRAARLIERMEQQGVVGPGDGAKPREVLLQQSLGG